MTLSEMTIAANNYTDENLDTSVTIDFANAAISKINAHVKASLPFIESASEEYTALDDYWQYLLIVNYICWGIKMNDSSIDEAREYLFQFQEGLTLILKNKNIAIDEEYRAGGFGNRYVIRGTVSLYVHSLPSKLTYDVGEEFDPTGLVVMSRDSYGKMTHIKQGSGVGTYKLSEPNMSTAGTKVVIITYRVTNSITKTHTFTITVLGG